MDCSLPGSSVHGIFQAKLLEWVAISFAGDLPNPWVEPGSPTLQADALPSEPPGKLCVTNVKRNVTKRTMLSTPNQGPGGQENSPESQSLPSQRTPSLLQHLMWWVSHPSGSFPSSLARVHTCNFHCVGLIHLHAHPSPLCCSPPPLFIQFTQQPQGPPLLC